MDPESWQFRLSTLFQDTLTPSQIQTREPLWRDGDAGFYSQQNNVIVRARSYDDPEMQAGRQEIIAGAGANAGIIIKGNDTLPDKSVVMSYADIVMHNAQYINLQTSGVNNLLWNSTPFNPRYNTYFTMPSTWRAAQDAYAFGQGTLPAIGDLQSASETLGIDLSATTPFGLYAALTPQKVPLMNGFMAMCLQMFIPFVGSNTLDETTGLPIPHIVEPICPAIVAGIPPGPVLPIAYTPPFLALATLAMMDLDTQYEPSIVASDIGQQVKQLAADLIPGVGAALGVL